MAAYRDVPVRKGLEFWVGGKDIRRRCFDILILKHEPFAQEQVASPLVFVPTATDGSEGSVPVTFSLMFDEATALMDELWNSGVRPSGVGSTGELAAVKYHLEDMRRLVSGLKPVNEGGSNGGRSGA